MEYISTFEHPNIVRYLEVYEDENYYYVVCECLKGDDIISTVWARGSYTEAYAASVILQVLQAT